MDILEAIRRRRSVRTFNGDPLPEAVGRELLEYAAAVKDPFGGRFSLRLKKFDLKNGYRPTTYGMIRGAEDYFMIAMADDDASALAVGFCFEKVVLKAWQLGFGTCWIAATFRGSDFDIAEPWPGDEKLRIVCPIGVAAGKSLMERIARLSVGSRKRKPFEDLFFTDGFSKSLSPDSRYGQSLEMVRLAPSSTNSQPWRALVDGDTVHFYYRSLGPLSLIDCGIALSHFHASETVLGAVDSDVSPFFRSLSVPAAPSGCRYLISYRPQ